MAVLLLAVLVNYVFLEVDRSQSSNSSLVAQKLRDEIEINKVSIDILRKRILEGSEESFEELTLATRYPYYIFSNRQLKFWSVHDYDPNYRDIIGDEPFKYTEIPRGKFVTQKETFEFNNAVYEIAFLIPLIEDFSIVNDYLQKSYNERIFVSLDFDLVSFHEDDSYRAITIEEQELFYVAFGKNYNVFTAPEITTLILLTVLSFVFAGIFIWKWVAELKESGRIWEGFLLLCISLVIIRGSMLLLSFPFDFIYIDLFDPRHYASSWINPSLGDLILNLICLLIIGIFVFSNFLRIRIIRSIITKSSRSKFIFATLAFFFTFFWLQMHYLIMRTLNYDSEWSMDITQNLDFDFYKFLGFAIFCLSLTIYFLFTHVSVRLFDRLTNRYSNSQFISVLIGLLLFIALSLVLQWDYLWVVVINLAFMVVISLSNVSRYITKLQFLTFIYIFTYGIPGSIIGVYANYEFDQSESSANVARLANQLLVERKFFTEIQLTDLINEIKEDRFIRDRLGSPYASKLLIEKKIRREYLSELDQFDVDIYAFNPKGEPFEEFKYYDNYFDVKVVNGIYQTDREDLYFIEQSQGQSTSQYMVFIDIEYRTDVVGHLLLNLKQKRLVPNSVFPLLINENKYSPPIENIQRYSYGVFVNGLLQYNSGDFNYRRYLEDFKTSNYELFDNNVEISDYIHRAYGDEGRFVIISYEDTKSEQLITNFSFLFLVYIISILIFLIVIALYQSVKQIKLNYAARIQLYLNFAFFHSFDHCQRNRGEHHCSDIQNQS